MNKTLRTLMTVSLAGLLLSLFPFTLLAADEGETTLKILPATWDSLRLGYDPIKALGVLSAYKESTGEVISLGPTDVESCTADRETLILTPEATQRLARVYAPDDPKLLGLKLETRHQAYLLVGQRGVLSGGIFLPRVSPMAIRYESISAEMKGCCLHLTRNSSVRGEAEPLPWPGGAMKCSL